MVRVQLKATNETENDIMLNFENMGNLTSPINSTSLSVVKFSIPNNGNPIIEFIENRWYFTLSYNGTDFEQVVEWTDIGTEENGIKKVFTVDHFTTMLNNALSDAITGLNAIETLPSVIVPRLLYNVDTSRFEFVVYTTAYNSTLATPIKIYCNKSLYYVLKSLPNERHPTNTVNKQFEFLFNPITENTYIVDYTKTVQENTSLINIAAVRNIIVTTTMPVEPLIITSDSINSNQSSQNIIQSYTVPYSNGFIDWCENLDFVQPENQYRSCKINGNNIYNIQCQLYYENYEGIYRPFILAPHQIATIELEFL